MPNYVLSEEDKNLLRGMVSEYLNRSVPPRVNTVPQGPIARTSDTYIALTPDSGIPPLDPITPGSTPSATAGDIPGSALCTIYRIHPTSGKLESVNNDQVKQLVYNLTSSNITGWTLVTLDRFGKWIASAPATVGATGTQIYVAKMQSGGIEGLIPVDYSSPLGNLGDEPASAYCDIYQIDPLGTGDHFVLLVTSQLVYNVYRIPIINPWVIVQQTTSGEWVIVGTPPTLRARARVTSDFFAPADSQISCTLLRYSAGWITTGETVLVTVNPDVFTGMIPADWEIDIYYNAFSRTWAYDGIGLQSFTGVLILGGLTEAPDRWTTDTTPNNGYPEPALMQVQVRNWFDTTPGIPTDVTGPVVSFDGVPVGRISLVNDDIVLVYYDGHGKCWYVTSLYEYERGYATNFNGRYWSFLASEAAGIGLIAAFDDLEHPQYTNDPNARGMLNVHHDCTLQSGARGALLGVDVHALAGPGLKVITGTVAEPGQPPISCPQLTLDPEAPNFQTIQVVTDVTWNSETCQMTKTTATIQVPL